MKGRTGSGTGKGSVAAGVKANGETPATKEKPHTGAAPAVVGGESSPARMDKTKRAGKAKARKSSARAITLKGTLH